jgi:uroporphyrin-III C-methyltransferase/precorrin-2 dehydrogenase/sirohydrochlorin ferrochelatase
MRHFPVFLELRGRRVLVLGQGEIAHIKAAALRSAGAEVGLAERFAPVLLDGCVLAVGADAPLAELQALSAEAQRRGVPVNIVDRPELCSFIMPAIVDRDPITIAVSTAGAAPVLARLIRARIEALLPPAYGRLAGLAERLKHDIRRRLPDVARRRAALERILGGRTAELLFAGHEAAAEAELEREVAAAETGLAVPATGMVALVGAGPGAADLLTLRAQRLLGEADVIVHDRLVTDEVLDLARRDAERIYVGKARADHCLPQEGINALLVRLAQEGRRVVRLKGGDPFIFGRGGEEAEALEAAGIPYEVVPGVTAALACAAQARIPLTHREASRAVTFVTGHTKDGTLDLDFAALAGSRATLAVYMGIVTLPRLRDGLLGAGLDPGTPAAVIERGGTTAQRVLHGTLDSLVTDAPAWSTGGPALVLVGEVVGRAPAITKALAAAADERPTVIPRPIPHRSTSARR